MTLTITAPEAARDAAELVFGPFQEKPPARRASMHRKAQRMNADVTTSGSTIPIGELSQRTGCIETIRYYERIGVLPVPLRRGRYRAYGPSDVRRLSFVRRARKLGFPTDSVRAHLALGDGGAASCSQTRDLASEHLRISA